LTSAPTSNWLSTKSLRCSCLVNVISPSCMGGQNHGTVVAGHILRTPTAGKGELDAVPVGSHNARS
jgi:hypothetical protein